MSNAPTPAGTPLSASAPTIGADVDLAASDITYSAYGDIVLIAGLATLQQRLYLRAITTPGTLLNHADFGMGLAQYVEEPLTNTLQAQLAQIVYDQCLLDPAVQSVQGVTVTQPQTGTLLIQPTITLAGGATATVGLVVTGGGPA